MRTLTGSGALEYPINTSGPPLRAPNIRTAGQYWPRQGPVPYSSVCIPDLSPAPWIFHARHERLAPPTADLRLPPFRVALLPHVPCCTRVGSAGYIHFAVPPKRQARSWPRYRALEGGASSLRRDDSCSVTPLHFYV